jgi:hypothetical protein
MALGRGITWSYSGSCKWTSQNSPSTTLGYNKGPLLISGEKSHGSHRTITPYVCMLNMGCGLGAGNDSSFL